MARSDEAQAFFHAVYSAVQEIPPGKVTSYGHIAKLVGTRNNTPFLTLETAPFHPSFRPSILPIYPLPAPKPIQEVVN